MTAGFLANLVRRNVRVLSSEWLNIQDSSPSANMFFERSLSFLGMSNSASALSVIVVSGTRWTW